MFDIYYKKNNNKKLFEYLEKNGFSNIQNYIPIYQLYFSLDENNYNNINLNNRYTIQNIVDKQNNNIFDIKCYDDKNNNSHPFQSFFKFSPLLDPIKYMVGKYKHLEKSKIYKLPSINSNDCIKKVLDTNNSAYIDSFFSYLSSKLLLDNGFIHGINFYGSFLSIQKEFNINIYDDLEYLYDSSFFHENKNKLFLLDDINEDILYSETRKYRKKIILDKKKNNLDIEYEEIDNNMFEGMFKLTDKNLKIHNNNNNNNNNNSLIEEYSTTINKKEKSLKNTSSTCSSRTSNTDNSLSISEEENSASDITNSQMSEYSSMESEETINSTILDFPIQIICLEKLENTLDYLIEKTDEISNKEWISCLFQIIMILITYQKVFDFTHNDLHTNNIMYIKTEKKFINYKYNNIYYRVPTYGKIFKIIDFGRAIYNFKGKIICSDSYHSKGDAATQYNFEPYFNKKKPRLEPNKSFDLCRLGCSLFDFFIEDINDQNNIEDPIANLIIEWTKDDKGRNILYKNNGEERYPEFKLYKMIVRTVHKHLPENQLKKDIFKPFISSKKKIKKQKIINIDNMESMCSKV
tara:strand:- start:1218 stop:2948 length:1731 start_codon:yes stop_codon:yes gene_type:complete